MSASSFARAPVGVTGLAVVARDAEPAAEPVRVTASLAMRAAWRVALGDALDLYWGSYCKARSPAFHAHLHALLTPSHALIAHRDRTP